MIYKKKNRLWGSIIVSVYAVKWRKEFSWEDTAVTSAICIRCRASRPWRQNYGGTAHKDSNSTSKGFLLRYIFRCRLAKVSKQNKPNEGFNTRSSQVLHLLRGSLASAVTIFMGCTSVGPNSRSIYGSCHIFSWAWLQGAWPGKRISPHFHFQLGALEWTYSFTTTLLTVIGLVEDKLEIIAKSDLGVRTFPEQPPCLVVILLNTLPENRKQSREEFV